MKHTIIKAILLWLTFTIGIIAIVTMSSLSMILFIVFTLLGAVVGTHYSAKELYILSGCRFFDNLLKKSED